MDRENKNALIVGGSGKIGSAVATRLKALGYHVFIAARNEQPLGEIQNKIGFGCQSLVLDVTWPSEGLTEFFTSFIDNYGKIDVLVYAAGSHGSLPFETCTSASFDESFSVDLKGCYFVCREYVKFMGDSDGQVIIISSLSAFKPAITSGQMAKWALRGFVSGLGEHCKAKNIRVLGIAPGHISEENNIEERILCTLEKVCNAPESFVVGETIIVD